LSEHVWQTDFPQAEAKAIGTAILARSFTLALVPEAWVVAEYALGLAVPTGVAKAVFHPADVEADPDAPIKELLQFTDAHADPHLLSAWPSLDWAAILKAILAAILAAIS
jgi:hypothetical protein